MPLSDHQEKNILSPEEADECYKSALRRVAIYLNSDFGRICKSSWLQKSDREIATLFFKKKLDNLLISYLVSKAPEGTVKVDKPSDDVRAEHEFYGRFQYQKRYKFDQDKKAHRLHVTFNSSEIFREWSLEKLHEPEINDKIIKDLFKMSTKVAYETAFTNYLVKNFWHNMIHLRLQKINELNFHEFAGEARYESDFVADNLANILLLKAYGHNIYVKGKQSLDKKAEYKRIFMMNRCNRVFAERAIRRKEEVNDSEAFVERSWRFKRQIANMLSAELLIQGAGVVDLAVYFSGKIKDRKDSRGGFYHTGEIIVRLNHQYYNTGCAPYLENDQAKNISNERKLAIKKNRSDRIQYVIKLVATQYIAELKRNIGLRSHAEKSFAALEARLLFW